MQAEIEYENGNANVSCAYEQFASTPIVVSGPGALRLSNPGFAYGANTHLRLSGIVAIPLNTVLRIGPKKYKFELIKQEVDEVWGVKGALVS